MKPDRRSAPARLVYVRLPDVDVLECGHSVSTAEIAPRQRQPRLKPGLGFRRCLKCQQGAPPDYAIPHRRYS